MSWKSLWARLLACCVVVGVGMVAIGCDGKPQGIDCTSDRDCPSNHSCVISSTKATPKSAEVAAPPVCTGSSESDRAFCSGGGTTTPPSQGTTGKCVANPQPTGCYSDRDCGSNQYCKPYGDSSAPSVDAPAPVCSGNSSGTTNCIRAAYKGQCADKPKTKTCRADSDCASDEMCEIAAAPTRCGAAVPNSGDPDDSAGFRAPVQCDAAPPSTGTCVKRPAPKRCNTNSDCSKGEVCQEQPSTGCSGGTMSGGGSTGAGMPERTSKCAPPAPIRVCVKQPTPVPPPVRTCENDKGCGNGEFCDFSAQGHTTDPDEDRAPSDPPEGSGFRAPMPEPPPQKLGICRPKPKVAFCRHDGDCKNGYRCGKGNPRLIQLCKQKGIKIAACLRWRPSRRGICQPIPPQRCGSDNDCGKGQHCVKTETSGDRAMPCDPNVTNCGVPAPPPEPKYGTCQPIPPKRCESNSDCGKGQRCVKTGSSGDRAMPCDPGATNCGAPAPPPEPQYGTCQDAGDDEPCTTTRRSDGTTCTTCNGVTRCSKATP